MKRLIAITLALAIGIASAAEPARTIEVDVNGLVCAFCAQGIQKTLKKLPAVADVFVSLEHRLVAVELKDGQDITDPVLTRAITQAGYKVVAIRRADGALAAIRARLGGKQGAAAGHDHLEGAGHGHD